jgi:hypothetical protein
MISTYRSTSITVTQKLLHQVKKNIHLSYDQGDTGFEMLHELKCWNSQAPQQNNKLC